MSSFTIGFLVSAIWSYVCWSVVNGIIANARGRDGYGIFAMSLFLGPLIAWAYVMGMPPKPKSEL